MQKPLPPSTPDGLLVPNSTFRYFESSQAHPFNSDSDALDLVNAWWLADASMLAYGDAPLIASVVESSGLRSAGFEARSFSGEATQCFVLHDDRAIIVTFRGTQVDRFWPSIMDVATDSRFLPVSDGEGVNIHHGFLDALHPVWDDVKAYINMIRTEGPASRTLWFAGHSLGAALATLSAERTGRELGMQVKGLYTFGSPRVGDNGFQRRVVEQGLAERTYRFVNNADIITRVPPRGIYSHVGSLEFIDNAGHLHHVDDEMQILPDLSAVHLSQLLLARVQIHGHTLPLLVPGFLADHAPVYYAVHVWNALDQSA